MDTVFYERVWGIKYGGHLSIANIEKDMHRFCKKNGNDILMQELVRPPVIGVQENDGIDRPVDLEFYK